MKSLYKLIIVAVSVNILTILFYSHLMTLQGESGEAWFIGLFCLPGIWIASIILAIVFTYRNRKEISLWVIFVLFFCTPLPIGFIYEKFIKSDMYIASSGIETRNNDSLMSEEWVYRDNNRLAVNKFYRIHGDPYDTSKYKRDSVWTYFNKKGHIMKIETYNDGKLISTVIKGNDQ